MAKRITIDPITRIEGHLRIDCEIEGGKVTNAWSSGQMWRGIELILSREPDTTFRVIADMFVSTFRRKESPGKGWSERWSDDIQKHAYAAVHEGVNEGVDEGVKQRLAMELATIHDHKGASRKMLEKSFEISTATAERDLAILKTAGLVRFDGAPKTGKYVLTSKAATILEVAD